ncbi:ATP-grasp domain-containing protein [Bacillus sp. FJAT-49711]|uniref:ATP-grasp domain-containing protein n=1 Tax=Bacillus sp. FJAT-49711 TaxID=2833585 RepID=UPI001BCA1884|nr:ATP-grasp domain-containing protein [Bacillus sp. FJAT-49711]MBS4220160.1 ATP-grasp domain-containing protein [Bacillus sp. FJAT-49711]
MNILICSVGRRVQLINYFKKELNKVDGKVIAVDCDPTAPALYHADRFEIVPRIDHPEYISILKNLCHAYKINGVLSLIDPELTLLSSFKEEFEKDGIHIFVSDKNAIDICYDKYLTHIFLQENDIPSVPTYIDLDVVRQDLNEGKLTFPLIVKPRYGSGSVGVQKVTNYTGLLELWEMTDDLIVQPFIDGSEYCVECYIDILTKEPSNLFSKRKINMRAGETDKSIAIKDPILIDTTYKLIEALKPSGPIDIDYFQTKDGYMLSEINPRFGGGYPYAYEMGQNFIKSMINNLNGIPNASYDKYLGDYEEGKTMVRYDHFIIL